MSVLMEQATTSEEGPLPPRLTSTEDDEDDDFPKTKRDDLAYLIRYETMIRQQEVDDMATMEHFTNCMKSFFSLEQASSDIMHSQVSYFDIKEALDELDTKPFDEAITTDKQLMMTLRLLAKNAQESAATSDMMITFTEIFHCYQTACLGMMHLRRLSPPSIVRERSRNRIMSMLELFQPEANRNLDNRIRSSNDIFEATDETEGDSASQRSSRSVNHSRSFFVVLMTLCVIVVLTATSFFFQMNPLTSLSSSPPISVNKGTIKEQPQVSLSNRQMMKMTAAVNGEPSSKNFPLARPTSLTVDELVSLSKSPNNRRRLNRQNIATTVTGITVGVVTASIPFLAANLANVAPILSPVAAGVVAASVVHILGRAMTKLIQNMRNN